MSSLARFVSGFTLSFLFLAGSALAQTGAIEGVVKGEDGQPLKDALIRIDRKDIKGKYEVKTRKKGDYLHAGLPLGTYRVSVQVNGQERDSVDNVRTTLGDPVKVNFDLQVIAARQQQMAKAAETGTLTEEQKRDMSPEQRAAIEKQVKERAAALAKNKELNDAFNRGKEALAAKNYAAAAEGFEAAAKLDPKQHVVWANLAESYMGLAATKTGAEKDGAVAKGLEGYQKALELLPTDASYHNNYALALARVGKFDEMKAELDKAVQLDAPNAGRYYYNLGAVLVNNGQMEPACDAFKKATDADPNYADAYYQYGICLTSRATNKPDGTIVFPDGTAEAFQKYLSLKPDGPFAESAKGMLQTMGSKLDTQYVAPGAKKPAPAKKK